VQRAAARRASRSRAQAPPASATPRQLSGARAPASSSLLPRRVAATRVKFAEGGVCTPHEAAALLASGAYTALDVRTPDEATYTTARSVNVPLIHGTWRFDTAAKRRLPQQRANAKFLDEVAVRFPDKAAPLLLVCSDGRRRTLAALRALDGAGYSTLAGLQGGFNALTRLYDAKLAPRNVEGDEGRDPWREVEGAAAFADGQTTGLNHGSSFERMDNPDNLLPMRDPVEWLDWAEAVPQQA
jgi:rhodanese-related sulfurtransferase